MSWCSGLEGNQYRLRASACATHVKEERDVRPRLSHMLAAARPVAPTLALMTFADVVVRELSRDATGSPHEATKKISSREFVQPSTLAHGSAKQPIHLAE